jgi:mono/diheme cytochrome c family protein
MSIWKGNSILNGKWRTLGTGSAIALLVILSNVQGQDKAGTTATDVGRKIFQTRCFVCHGREGKGDGPAATGLGANPRNFTDPAWQNSITDDRLRQVIKGGGGAAGESSAMPPNSDLTSEQLESIIRYIRSFGKN